ncbi:hypothetical protein D104_03575 [Marinomonas profundimaris]|uniref:Uncharacterized protein n=1 Tax=Marinomonas profundimaris TaxID=1208321 RepID=W1S1V3_9GAMM|nr:hypothetical protein D104_03575 [Marinomonas profundimaris]
MSVTCVLFFLLNKVDRIRLYCLVEGRFSVFLRFGFSRIVRLFLCFNNSLNHKKTIIFWLENNLLFWTVYAIFLAIFALECAKITVVIFRLF